MPVALVGMLLYTVLYFVVITAVFGRRDIKKCHSVFDGVRINDNVRAKHILFALYTTMSFNRGERIADD